MRLYTKDECEQWLRDHGRIKPDEVPDRKTERIIYPPEPHRLYYFAYWIATSLTYRMPTLLWITEWAIWGSSENWHLYYALRRQHRDDRLLHEAPGHLFLAHETEDLASFLQVAMLNGWGGYILTQADYVNVFFSHDEYLDFYARPDGNLSEVREALGPSGPDRLRISDSVQ